VTARVRDIRQAFGAERMTAQRETLARVAGAMGGAFTIDDLAAEVRKREITLGLATVYRGVAALERTGWLERVGERDGSALFARCRAGGHHHHLICTGCGRIEAADCPLEEIVGPAESATGFVVTGHEITLYGLCPDCASAQRD